MPTYIRLYKWTQEGLANIKDPERIKRAKANAEKLGVRYIGISQEDGEGSSYRGSQRLQVVAPLQSQHQPAAAELPG